MIQGIVIRIDATKDKMIFVEIEDGKVKEVASDYPNLVWYPTTLDNFMKPKGNGAK